MKILIWLFAFLLTMPLNASAWWLVQDFTVGASEDYVYYGHPGAVEGAWIGYGVEEVDRAYIHSETAGADGTVDAVKLYINAVPEGAYQYACVYNGQTLVGKVDISFVSSVGWTDFLTVAEESSGSLDYDSGDYLNAGLCIDGTGTVTNTVAYYLGEDNGNSGNMYYNTSSWATNPPASITWTSSTHTGLGVRLRCIESGSSSTPTVSAHLDFENDMNDDSGNGNNFTNGSTAISFVTSGGPAPIDGSYSGYRSSSGGGACIAESSSDLPWQDSNTDGTLCFKYETTSIGTTQYIVNRYDHATDKRTYAATMPSTDAKITYRVGYNSGASSDATIKYGTAISANTLYGICVAFNSSTSAYRMKIYDYDADAVLGTEISGTISNTMWVSPDVETCVGYQSGGHGDGFVGYIDTVKWYDTSLTSAQMDSYFGGTL